jgi:glycosyltransferase involved in cell wall biosynthesis
MSMLTRLRRAAPLPADPDPVAAVASAIEQLPDGQRRAAIRQRCAELLAVLAGREPGEGGTADLVRSLSDALSPLDPARSWLMLAVLGGRYPDGSAVAAVVRAAELDGTLAVVIEALRDVVTAALDDIDESAGGRGPAWPDVRVVVGQTLVDVHHTATAGFATGIQRVTREVTRRWYEAHRPTLVGWHRDLSGMRMLTPDESRRARWGGPEADVPAGDPLVVPWRCRYILPELAAEVVRAGHLQTMARYSGTSLNMIGYDLVPMTTAETSHEGMVPGFARNLAAARYARVVVPISEGAAVEYRGWRAMLAGAGLAGPRIEAVVLPAEAQPESAEAMRLARSRIPVGRLPAVVVVGSHEPRKNHLAVLHSAELLWREGRRFSLCFIGGNSWNSEDFTRTLEDLQAAGRPVEALLAVDDDLLWGAYRVARFTVFPSLNEGFGLPVAESLACGTPVITSGFGSMKEIADDGGGALLVDPRDDASLTDAMRALLVDDGLLAELQRRARSRPVRTWDTYAFETWRALTGSAVEEAEPDPKAR